MALPPPASKLLGSGHGRSYTNASLTRRRLRL